MNTQELKKLENRIINRIMESKVFGGNVPVVFNLDEPETVLVDGVKYENAELKTLLAKGLDAEDLLAAHNTKCVFGGAMIPSERATEIESYPITRW